jgi:hypothetical protein
MLRLFVRIGTYGITGRYLPALLMSALACADVRSVISALKAIYFYFRSPVCELNHNLSARRSCWYL